MAAEDQELRLVVTVDDRASAQIERMQATLRQMGTGSQAAGMERTRRQTGEVGTQMQLSEFGPLPATGVGAGQTGE